MLVLFDETVLLDEIERVFDGVGEDLPSARSSVVLLERASGDEDEDILLDGVGEDLPSSRSSLSLPAICSSSVMSIAP